MSGVEFKAGDIIVAHPDLAFDKEFGGSVIVLLAHGQSTVGVNIATGQITGNLFKGGPLAMPVPIALHRVADSVATSRPIGNSGFAITELDNNGQASELFAKKPQNTILVTGYAGWGPGQLESEFAQGVWQKVEHVDLESLLGMSPKLRWKLATAAIDYSQNPPATAEYNKLPPRKPPAGP